MNNFIFYNPVRLIFGEGTASKISELVPADAKVLLVYGGGSAKKNGSFEQVTAALGSRKFVEFSGIEPNPEYETCMRAVSLIKAEKLNYIIALGGGSVIDASKFIAAAALYENGDPWDIAAKGAPIKAALPLAAVVTLPATCSEMNMWAVVSRREFNMKMGFSSELVAPKFSVLDPTFTLSLPLKQTRNGVVDAFAHAMEQYITYPADAPLQERFAESVMSTLAENGLKVIRDEKNLKLRANIMLCAAMAHNQLLGMGVPQDWSSHLIGHQLTALYGVDHGESLAIVMPKVLEYKKAQKAEKIAQLAERVFGIRAKTKSEAVDAGIAALKKFFKDMGAPVELSDLNLPADAPKKCAENFAKYFSKAGEHGDINSPDVEKILTM